MVERALLNQVVLAFVYCPLQFVTFQSRPRCLFLLLVIVLFIIELVRTDSPTNRVGHFATGTSVGIFENML